MRNIYMSKIRRFFYGLIIGIAAVTPGVSGGVIAAAYGIYEPSVYAITDFKKNPSKSISWLLPIGLGILIGILVFARLLMTLINTNYNTVMVVFCGLVAGSIPSLVNEAKGEISRKNYAVLFCISFLLSIYLTSYIKSFYFHSMSSVIKWMIIGCVVSAGTVIPGISSSFILIKMGLYDMYISCLGGNDISGAVTIGLAFIVTSACLFKGIEILFSKYRGYAYCIVCAFLSASAVTVFPDLRTLGHIPGYILLFALSVVVGYFVIKEK